MSEKLNIFHPGKQVFCSLEPGWEMLTVAEVLSQSLNFPESHPFLGLEVSVDSLSRGKVTFLRILAPSESLGTMMAYYSQKSVKNLASARLVLAAAGNIRHFAPKLAPRQTALPVLAAVPEKSGKLGVIREPGKPEKSLEVGVSPQFLTIADGELTTQLPLVIVKDVRPDGNKGDFIVTFEGGRYSFRCPGGVKAASEWVSCIGRLVRGAQEGQVMGDLKRFVADTQAKAVGKLKDLVASGPKQLAKIREFREALLEELQKIDPNEHQSLIELLNKEAGLPSGSEVSSELSEKIEQLFPPPEKATLAKKTGPLAPLEEAEEFFASIERKPVKKEKKFRIEDVLGPTLDRLIH